MKKTLCGFFMLFASAVWAMEPQDIQVPANADDATMPCPDIPEKIKTEVLHCCRCGGIEDLWANHIGSKYMCGSCLKHLSMKWKL